MDNAARAEAIGLDRYIVQHGGTVDCFAFLGLVADRVPRIGLASGVTTTHFAPPFYMASLARTLNQISGGRFTLGLGASHQLEVEDMLGQRWHRPYSRTVQYLDALLPLLSEQTVDVEGDLISQQAEIGVDGSTPDVMLGAMGPRMLRLAAERTWGALVAWTGPRAIESYVRPTLGDDAGLSAVVTTCVTTDPDGTRAALSEMMAGYRSFPPYTAMVEREGVDDMMDLLVIGDADTVRRELQRYRAAGADELAVLPLATSEADIEATWDLLESGI